MYENAFRCECGRIQNKDMLEIGGIGEQGEKYNDSVPVNFVCPDCGAPFDIHEKITVAWDIDIDPVNGRIERMNWSLSPHQEKKDKKEGL